MVQQIPGRKKPFTNVYQNMADERGRRGKQSFTLEYLIERPKYLTAERVTLSLEFTVFLLS